MTATERYAGGATDWDAEYAAGVLDRLDRLGETARLGVVAGYAARIAAGGALLDAGAGPAVLAPLLSGPLAPARYLGFDLSPLAAERGAARLATLAGGPAEAHMVCAGIEDFDPDGGLFDLIVFNEVLFFVDDAAAQLARYRDFLAPDGAVLISLHLPKRAESGAHAKFAALMAAVDADWTTLDEVALDGLSTGNHWRLRLARPARG
ncbi:MAG: class I SAM-dependent methyltransferase [Pseudomonadota bacterium]